MSERAVIYARLSKDPDGTKTSTERQVNDCRDLSESRGWQVVEVIRDNDLSAYNGAERPGFRRLLGTVAAGEADVVVAWANDRLYRRTRDQLDLMEALAAAGGTLATVKDGEVDPGTAEGRMRLGILANVAEFESGRKAERVRAGKLEAARAGRPSGGGRRPFGYQPGGMELEPSEAGELKEAAAAVLAGRSLRSVVIDWNERGVVGARGGAWRVSTLRQVLLSPRIAGLRAHKGEVIGEAAWPAIVSRDDHERLVAMLKDPSRRVSTTSSRKYLLGGFARCGKCGHVLVSAPGPRGRTYSCKRDPGRREACGGLRVPTDWLDELVSEAVIAALDSPKLDRVRKDRKEGGPGADLIRQLQADEKALEDLTRDRYVERTIGHREFLAAHGALLERIERIRRQLAEEASRGVVAALPGGDLRAWWEQADLEERRAVIGALVERISVNPIGRGRRWADHDDHVEVTWRA